MIIIVPHYKIQNAHLYLDTGRKIQSQIVSFCFFFCLFVFFTIHADMFIFSGCMKMSAST